jgi:DNA-binding MarR family transcriptional regulator
LRTIVYRFSDQLGQMLDRYEPRHDNHRDRGDLQGRDWGSRGGGDGAGGRDEGGVHARHVDLPRGPEREVVRERKQSYELNGREAEALATVAAFRVVQASDVHQILGQDRGERPAQKSLDHLQASGLLERIPLERRDEDVVVLTERGRNLLEANRREHAGEPGQAFYAGLKKPRELTHDAQVYRACRDAGAQIRDQDGRVRRVVLDYELKREYQQFLQERNRGRADSTGRPDRTPEEIAAWAKEHDLPCQDNRVRFPDARIEFEDRDRQEQHRDIEVVTPHYRGAHAAAVARSGFQSYGGALRLQTSGRRGGRGLDPRLAEEITG